MKRLFHNTCRCRLWVHKYTILLKINIQVCLITTLKILSKTVHRNAMVPTSKPPFLVIIWLYRVEYIINNKLLKSTNNRNKYLIEM